MKRDLSGIIALLLTALFGLMIIPAVASGGKIYEEISSRSDEIFDKRTAYGYIATQLRSCEGGVYTDDSFGFSLNIPVILEDGEYITKIYCHNGYLYELFCERDAELSPEDGSPLIRLESLSGEIKDGLLTLDLDGQLLQMEVGR